MEHAPSTEPRLQENSLWLKAASPKDQDAKLAYACYFLLGAGVLAPWNALLMAADYWSAVYPGRHVDRTFTICYLPTCLLFIGVFIRFPKLLSRRLRILTGFGGFFCLMLAVPMIDVIFVHDKHSEGPPGAYALLLLTVLLVGVLDGISQGAIFGDAATLPSEYTHAVVGGTASSGALISLLRIATKASLPPTRAGLRTSTALYFGLSAAISLACFGVYSAVLPRLGVVSLWRRRRASSAGGGSRRGSLDEGSAGSQGGRGHPCLEQQQYQLQQQQRRHRDEGNVGEGEAVVVSEQQQYQLQQQQRRHRDEGNVGEGEAVVVSENGHGLTGHEPLMHQQTYSHDGAPDQEQRHPASPGAAAAAWQDRCSDVAPPRWRDCMASVWRLALAITLIYVVTLAIFPGVLAEDTHNVTLGDWYPLMLMTLFNICDLAGKNVPLPRLAEAAGSMRRQGVLLGLCIARVVFLPAFLVAVRLGAPAAVVAVLCVALGISNGYLTALIMTSAHAMAANSAAADMLENMMVFCLVLGLLLGALLGWWWIL